MKFHTFNFKKSALAAGLMVASASVAAQQLEEIVVTAQFREENVQDAPIAITAITGAMLEARAQTNVFEVASQAPNVTLKPGGPARSGMMAYIRGIGQVDFIAALEPGVGIYVDDIYYAQMTSSLLDLLDVDRLEILRGPQGTLAGRNSIGGAIKLYSKKPGDGDAKIQVGYGSYSQTDVRGSADFELLPDTLYTRIAGASRSRDGYVKSLDYGCVYPNSNVRSIGGASNCLLDEHGEQTYTTARVSTRWIASDDVEVNVIADYLNDRSGAQAGTLLWGDRTAIETSVGPTGDYANPMVSIEGKDGNPVAFRDHMFVTSGPFQPANSINDPYANYATRIDQGNCLLTSTGTAPVGVANPDPLIDGYEPGGEPYCPNVAWKPSSLPSRNTLNQWGISAQVDWTLSDITEIVSLSSYRQYDSWTTWDSDYSPIPVTQLDNYLTNWQISQELRLNSSIGDVDYTVGGYYLKQNSTYEARVDLNYALIDFIHGPDPTPAETWAVFANAAWHVTDRLNLTAGVRYSDEYKSYTHYRRNADRTPIAVDGGATPADPTFPINIRVSGLYDTTAVFEDTLTDWRLAADYTLTDNTMIYASASTGYKSGGINPRPFFAVQVQTFSPENLTAYELGFKSTLLDNSLRLNAAVFFNDYEDIQVSLNECARPVPPFPTPFGAPCALPSNVGNADIKGFELETEWYLTDDFFIDASFSTLDFEYTKLQAGILGGTEIAPLDMTTPYTPETSWSIGAQWGTRTAHGDVNIRVDATYQDDIYTNPANGELNKIDSYTLTNARLWWQAPDQDWELGLEVQNLTDELYYYTKFDQNNSVGQITGTPALPRTYRLTATKSF